MQLEELVGREDVTFETRGLVAVGAALKREHSILAVGEIEAPALLQPDSKALLLELAVEFDAVLDDLSLVARTEEAQDSGAVLGGAIRNLALSEIYFKTFHDLKSPLKPGIFLASTK